MTTIPQIDCSTAIRSLPTSWEVIAEVSALEKEKHGEEEKENGTRGKINPGVTVDVTNVNEENEEGNNEDNDEDYQRGEPFETYKPKIVQLCHDIGYGEPLEVEEMDGGSYHRVISLEFASEDTSSCILRIPWFPYDHENQPHELSDQISVLQYLSQFDYLQITSILAYDTTVSNAIESQYVLQTKLPGNTMEQDYYELPLQEKLELATCVAELMIKMESITFDKPGRLIGDRSLPLISHTAPESTNSINIIGYHASPYVDMPSMEERSSLSWIQTLLQFRGTESKVPDLNMMCRKLQRIASQMQRAGFMRTTDNKNVLWHWDFAARNVLAKRTSDPPVTNINTDGLQRPATPNSVEIQLPVTDQPGQWKITGVLDWDDVLSVPLIIARRPPAWLWFNEDDRGYWDGENDAKLPRDLTGDELLIKAHFDQIMANASLTYIEDTYHRGPWLRELARFGLDGFPDSSDHKRWEPFVQKWDAYFALTGLKTSQDDEDEKEMIREWAMTGGFYGWDKIWTVKEANRETEKIEEDESDHGENAFAEFKPKIIQLCLDIGYLEPTDVEKMGIGSCNDLYELFFESHENQRCVLRVPAFPYDEKNMRKIDDQVSVLCHLAQYDFLHVPNVLAFDKTNDNALSAQYVLQGRIPGVQLERVFYDLSLAEKLQMTTKIAELVIKMSDIRFDFPGQLAGKRDLPLRSNSPPTVLANISHGNFSYNPAHEMPPLETQSLPSLLRAMLNLRLAEEPNFDFINEKYETLQKMCIQMKKNNMFRTRDKQNALWHWDFAARNIMVQRKPKATTDGVESEGEWEISGVLDWDEVLAVPTVIARAPVSWLWFNEDERNKFFGWDGNYDRKLYRSLTQDELIIKGCFDQLMSNAIPTYLEDTYGRGYWVRQLTRFVLWGLNSNEDFNSCFDLLDEWQEYLESMEIEDEDEDEEVLGGK